MRVVAPALANLMLIVAALSLGSTLRRLIPANFSRMDRVVVILLGGIGLLGTVLFCVGQIRFSRLAIVTTLAACILLGLRSLLAEVRQFRPLPARFEVPWMPAAIVAAVLLVTAVGGLSLPVGDMNNDAIAYHYLGPSVWLRQEIIRPVPDELLTYFPVLVETQYAALFSLGGDRAPGLFAVAGLASLLLAGASLGRRLGLDSAGVWWVAAVIAAMPAVYRGAYGGFLDALFAAFVLLAARIVFDAQRLGHYALCGLFCGAAMGAKYTGIVAVALLLFSALLIGRANSRRRLTDIVPLLAVASAAAILIASPFYLRNWVMYGCPIYPPPPALLHFFQPKGISPLMVGSLLQNVAETGRGMGGGMAHFLLLPFNLTYHTANFRGAGGIGLVPWALAPFGMIALRRSTFAQGLALFGALQVTAWFLTAQVSRYLIAVYVLGAVFGVFGWRYVTGLRTRFGAPLCSLVLAISISYGLFMIFSDRVDDVHAALSQRFEQIRRLRDIPWLESFDFINGTPAVQKVLILDQNVAPYYIHKNYVKPVGRWGEHTLPGAANLTELLSAIPTLHVTHVLDVRLDGESFQLQKPPADFVPVFQGNNQIVYRVGADPL